MRVGLGDDVSQVQTRGPLAEIDVEQCCIGIELVDRFTCTCRIGAGSNVEAVVPQCGAQQRGHDRFIVDHDDATGPQRHAKQRTGVPPPESPFRTDCRANVGYVCAMSTKRE